MNNLHINTSIIVFLLFYPFQKPAIAQFYGSPWPISTDYRAPVNDNRLYSSFSAAINSTSLSNRFYSTVYSGRAIDEAMKESISSRLKSVNMAGGDMDYRIGLYNTFTWKRDNLSPPSGGFRGWFFELAGREHFDLKFSDDLLNLAFFGNKRFAGETAGLGGFSLNLLRYQQAKAGFVFSDTTGGLIGGSISYIKGEQHLAIRSNRHDLYTSSIGDVLALSGDIDIRQTDTTSTGFGAFNGNGFSASFFLRWTYDMFIGKQKKKGYIYFGLDDLGMVYWNNRSLQYYKDTAYYFEGMAMDSIAEFDLLGTQISRLADSITAAVNYGAKKSVYNTPLPSIIRFSVVQEHSDKMTFEVGALNRYHANYKPYIYVRESYRVRDNVTVSLLAGYGGYGGFAVGTEGRVNTKRVDFAFGLTNLEGFAFPVKNGGMGAWAVVRYRIE